MQFEEKVFEVLRNFMEYGNYKGKIDQAVAAIKKKYPVKSQVELTSLFENCTDAYKEAILLVKKNLSHYSANNSNILEEEIEFRKKHAQVPDQLLTWIIGWIYHWYHER